MYTDLLIKIKNAQSAKKRKVETHFSKMDLAILETLVKEGYLENVTVQKNSSKNIVEINLCQEPKIHGIKFISIPSRRVYFKSKEIRAVKSSYGILILSTSKGVITGKEAKKKNFGGQALFEIY